MYGLFEGIFLPVRMFLEVSDVEFLVGFDEIVVLKLLVEGGALTVSHV